MPDTRAALAWRFGRPWEVLSSAAVGGGRTRTSWILNIGVPSDYARTDLGAHAAEVATRASVTGSGVVLFTAVDVADVVAAVDGDVRADVTVGVRIPTWAAAPAAMAQRVVPGTINTVLQVPEQLSPGAAVNAVITATEAKTQALVEADVPGTGTASDAVVICWPGSGPIQDFAGPRSDLGGRIARAVHAAVSTGLGADT